MEDIAWIIRTKDVNRPMGFAQNEENEIEEGDVEIVPAD
jgi:hypothetical protein